MVCCGVFEATSFFSGWKTSTCNFCAYVVEALKLTREKTWLSGTSIHGSPRTPAFSCHSRQNSQSKRGLTHKSASARLLQNESRGKWNVEEESAGFFCVCYCTCKYQTDSEQGHKRLLRCCNWGAYRPRLNVNIFLYYCLLCKHLSFFLYLFYNDGL